MPVKFSMAILYVLLSSGLVAPAQQTGGAPAPIQPGAPGHASHTLTALAAAPVAKPPSEADIRFMQDMVMHHGQAVEMTELLQSRGSNPQVLDMGRKIDVSQTDEIRWMKQWLAERGIAIETMSAPMPGMDHAQMPGMDHSTMHHAGATDPMDVAMMPGMLTPRQMQTLRGASGPRFDQLFLTGMIQHHTGALLMVKQLFSNPGAGQDPFLFDFANDVDNTQTAEIDIMKGILRTVKTER